MAHRVSQRSPVTGRQVPSHYLHASDAYFRDVAGRAVLLRGVNLSGSSKAPVNKPSQELQGFWDDAEAGGRSFVGRPLDLTDGSADVHLARLRSWGVNSFRYVFTWEALEHDGPGKYDHEFIQYTVDVLRKIKEYGFRVYMDPHQDLFSRFTGGSGAPYWVLPACGMNPRNFTPTQAALIHSEWPSQEDPSPIDFPDMIWATNYTRLAAATLSVLFFAGRDFAPKCIIDDQNIQDWLQSHFINAVKQLAQAVASADGGALLDSCVVGWDSMNEPNKTYIGLTALNKLPAMWKLRKGPMPTPLQSFITGVGKAQEVENYIFGPVGPKRQGSVVVDPKGKSIWMTAQEDEHKGGSQWGWRRHPQWPLGQCLWAAHGVWNEDTNEIIDNAYFSKFGGPKGTRPVDFVEDYWLPHWRAYSAAIRPFHPEAIMFLQPPVFEPPPKGLTEDDLKNRACVSSHFYDGLTLITKHWNWFNADAVGLMRGKYLGVPFALRFGYRAIRQCMRDQLGYLRSDTLDVLGQYPTIIGEIGIPFDLDQRKAYYGDAKGNGKGDFGAQTAALDASINACDGTNVLSYSLWTYCPDNTHRWGDGWNGEDLSLWGLDDVRPLPDSLKRVRTRTNASSSSSGASSSSNLNLLSSSTAAAASSASKMGAYADSSLSLDHKETAKSGKSPTFQLDLGEAPSESAAVGGLSSDPSSALDLAALSNGARSAVAFVRPYPIACNGVPIEINFDVKTSEFDFVLEVDEADLAPQPVDVKIDYGRVGVVGGAARGGGVDGRASGVLPTEIFLPFLHYGRDATAASAMGGNGVVKPSAGEGDDRPPVQDADVDEDGAARESSGRRRAQTDKSTSIPLSLSGASSSASSSNGTARQRRQRLEYDVEVEVSAGSWVIRGQYLYWSLPPSAGDVEQVRQVLVAAEAAEQGAADSVDAGARESQARRRRGRRQNAGRGGAGAGPASASAASARVDQDEEEQGKAPSYALRQTGSSTGGGADVKRPGQDADVQVDVIEAVEDDAGSGSDDDQDDDAGGVTTIPSLLPVITDAGKVRHRIRIVRKSGAVRSSAGGMRRRRRRGQGGRGGLGAMLSSFLGPSTSSSSSHVHDGRRRRMRMLMLILVGLFFLVALALLIILLATLRPR